MPTPEDSAKQFLGQMLLGLQSKTSILQSLQLGTFSLICNICRNAVFLRTNILQTRNNSTKQTYFHLHLQCCCCPPPEVELVCLVVQSYTDSVFL